MILGLKGLNLSLAASNLESHFATQTCRLLKATSFPGKRRRPWQRGCFESCCGAAGFVIQCGCNCFSLWIKPCSVTILWKATKQYFHVFCCLFCGFNFFILRIKPCIGKLLNSAFMWSCLVSDTASPWFLSFSTEMTTIYSANILCKATEQCFHLVLFVL